MVSLISEIGGSEGCGVDPGSVAIWDEENRKESMA
jgi:hypothetical protein